MTWRRSPLGPLPQGRARSSPLSRQHARSSLRSPLRAPPRSPWAEPVLAAAHPHSSMPGQSLGCRIPSLFLSEPCLLCTVSLGSWSSEGGGPWWLDAGPHPGVVGGNSPWRAHDRAHEEWVLGGCDGWAALSCECPEDLAPGCALGSACTPGYTLELLVPQGSLHPWVWPAAPPSWCLDTPPQSVSPDARLTSVPWSPQTRLVLWDSAVPGQKQAA